MRHIVFPAFASLALTAFSGFALAQDLCSANAASQVALAEQTAALVCSLEALDIEGTQAEVARLEAELADAAAMRADTRAALNDSADSAIKLDAKISTLLADANVSNDDSILIVGSVDVAALAILQEERDVLAQESLSLQSTLDELDAAHMALNADYASAQAALAAAEAGADLQGQALTPLLTALGLGDGVATSICGMTATEVSASCEAQ